MSRNQIGFNVQDFRIAVGIVLLGTREKAAEFAGISPRKVYYRLEKNQEFFDEVTAILEECLRLRRRDVEQVTADKWLEKYEQAWAKAFEVAIEEIEKGNYAAARDFLKNAENRKFGLPASTLKIEGQVTQNVVYLNPAMERLVEGIERLALGSSPLYLPPADAEEAQIVDTATTEQGRADGETAG